MIWGFLGRFSAVCSVQGVSSGEGTGPLGVARIGRLQKIPSPRSPTAADYTCTHVYYTCNSTRWIIRYYTCERGVASPIPPANGGNGRPILPRLSHGLESAAGRLLYASLPQRLVYLMVRLLMAHTALYERLEKLVATNERFIPSAGLRRR